MTTLSRRQTTRRLPFSQHPLTGDTQTIGRLIERYPLSPWERQQVGLMILAQELEWKARSSDAPTRARYRQQLQKLLERWDHLQVRVSPPVDSSVERLIADAVNRSQRAPLNPKAKALIAAYHKAAEGEKTERQQLIACWLDLEVDRCRHSR